ncbi:hypothetical protein SOVF_042670 [Spinacia oleracea]|nr:hypothetical protein SOVF_042670 [Spinacia oleracea]
MPSQSLDWIICKPMPSSNRGLDIFPYNLGLSSGALAAL